VPSSLSSHSAEVGVKIERRRRLVFAVLLGVALLGALAFMASVLLDDTFWRILTQVVGLTASATTATSLVVTVRRWGADDDFWWPDVDQHHGR
jgi:hypothetical protein